MYVVLLPANNFALRYAKQFEKTGKTVMIACPSTGEPKTDECSTDTLKSEHNYVTDMFFFPKLPFTT